VIRNAEYTSTVVLVAQYYIDEANFRFGSNTSPQSHGYTNLHFAQSIISYQSRGLRRASLAARMKVY